MKFFEKDKKIEKNKIRYELLFVISLIFVSLFNVNKK